MILRQVLAAGLVLGALALPQDADAAPAKGKSAKEVSPARAAMLVRQRACAAEWKADKAAGKVQSGQTWPKYWSACNKRKKAAAT